MASSTPRTPRATLVTGGAGFIGSHLVEHLIAQGDRVVVVDDLSTGRESNLEHVFGPQLELVSGRIADVLHDDPFLLGKVDRVFHLAAAVGVRLIVDQPVAAMRNNLEQTAALIDAAANYGTPVLLASSSEVYGKGVKVPMAEGDDALFGPTTSARWSYGLSKAMDEHLALAQHRRSDLGVVIARLFNTIGPRQVGHYGMVVPRFVEQALSGMPLEVFGDGTQTRAFCDVRDVVHALSHLMETDAFYGQIFNVGHDDEISINTLADMVIELCGSRSQKRHVPFAEAYDHDFEDLKRRVPDLSLIRKAIAFCPQYKIQDTLGEVIASLREGLHVATGGGTT